MLGRIRWIAVLPQLRRFRNVHPKVQPKVARLANDTAVIFAINFGNEFPQGSYSSFDPANQRLQVRGNTQASHPAAACDEEAESAFLGWSRIRASISRLCQRHSKLPSTLLPMRSVQQDSTCSELSCAAGSCERSSLRIQTDCVWPTRQGSARTLSREATPSSLHAFRACSATHWSDLSRVVFSRASLRTIMATAAPDVC